MTFNGNVTMPSRSNDRVPAMAHAAWLPHNAGSKRVVSVSQKTKSSARVKKILRVDSQNESKSSDMRPR